MKELIQMKTICATVIAALLAAAPLALWSQNAPDGAGVFKSRCAACHGDKGEGTLAGKIPAIKGTALTVEKLVAFVTKGGNGTTVHYSPIVNINNDEAIAVALHVRSLK
jgi:mono/diheme cytochrome c family protein